MYYSILDTEWRDPSHRAHQLALRHGITPAATNPIAPHAAASVAHDRSMTRV